ncbi:MAG: type II toxin-antitoxin system VapC family toxin [Chloroflexota bacterium]|nr:type II toxin-antitoxin system VapC family toxin [Chloroflexota bacterium]
MSGNLFDTNAVIALQKAEPNFLELLNSDEETFIPSIVIGELYFGAYHSGRVVQNLADVAKIVSRFTVLTCDATTGKLYGFVKKQLLSKQRPIPENDIWIAAIAIQHHLLLLTRDQHFTTINGLAVRHW